MRSDPESGFNPFFRFPICTSVHLQLFDHSSPFRTKLQKAHEPTSFPTILYNFNFMLLVPFRTIIFYLTLFLFFKYIFSKKIRWNSFTLSNLVFVENNFWLYRDWVIPLEHHVSQREWSKPRGFQESLWSKEPSPPPRRILVSSCSASSIRNSTH